MSIISNNTGKVMIGDRELPIESFSFEYEPASEPEQDWRDAMEYAQKLVRVFDIPVQLMGTRVVESTLVIVEEMVTEVSNGKG